MSNCMPGNIEKIERPISEIVVSMKLTNLEVRIKHYLFEVVASIIFHVSGSLLLNIEENVRIIGLQECRVWVGRIARK